MRPQDLGSARRHSVLGSVVLFAAAALGAAACSADGATAVCPELPLYNPHDLEAPKKPENAKKQKAAEDAGCATQTGDAQSVQIGVDGGGG